MSQKTQWMSRKYGLLCKLDSVVPLVTYEETKKYLCLYIYVYIREEKKLKKGVKHDMWHVTCDTLQVGGVEPSLKTLAP